MNALKSPKFWIVLWGGLGALVLLYGIIVASVQPGPQRAASVLHQDHSLLTGEMEDFTYPLMAEMAPDIPFEHEGETVSLADFRGRAVLVNFWATWCAPCLKELPSLDALEAELGDDDFEVVAIAADPRGPEAARDYLDRLNIKNLKLYADPRLLLAGSMGAVNVLPVTILYDAEGREVGRLVGEADWQSPEAIRLVRSAKP